jgi:hypothetical protein
MRCGNYVESQYYIPKIDTKGGGIFVSDDVCAFCYVQDDILSPDEMIMKLDLIGKTPLPICRGCFDDSWSLLVWVAARMSDKLRRNRNNTGRGNGMFR